MQCEKDLTSPSPCCSPHSSAQPRFTCEIATSHRPSTCATRPRRLLPCSITCSCGFVSLARLLNNGTVNRKTTSHPTTPTPTPISSTDAPWQLQRLCPGHGMESIIYEDSPLAEYLEGESHPRPRSSPTAPGGWRVLLL